MSTHRSIRSAVDRRARDETGAGLIGSFLGALVFLGFLALATHSLVGLYATSVVTAVAWDETRRAAQSNDLDIATESTRTRLSGFDDLRVNTISNDNGDVSMTVRVKRPFLVPTAIAEQSRLTHIERTVTVRSETMR